MIDLPLSAPEDWDVVPLGSITRKIGSGATPRGGESAYIAAREQFALIRSQSVFDRFFDLSTLSFITNDQAYDLRSSAVQKGDVLLNITGDGVTFGRAAMVPDAALPACVNQHVSIVRADDTKLAPGYLLAYLTHSKIKPYIESFNAGGSRRAITKGNIESFLVPLPPLAAQQEIARVLGVLDTKIEANRRMNATLEALARALFKSWFVDFEPVRAKMEGRALGMASDLAALFPGALVQSKMGPIPKHWEVKSVSDFADVKGGKQLSPESFVDAGLVPVFGGAGEMGRTNVHNADGFVISIGRVGAYCGQFFGYRGPAWINNNASWVRQHDSVPGEWLLLALRNLDVDLVKKGAAQPFVSNSDVAAMHLLAPPGALVEAFQEVAEPIMRRAELALAEVKVLGDLRDLLLPKLLSGDLRVGDAEHLVGDAA